MQITNSQMSLAQAAVPLFMCTIVLHFILGDAAKLSKTVDDTPGSGIPPSLSIENLQLGETNSRSRGRTSPSPNIAAPTTTTTSNPMSGEGKVLYRLDNKDGKACILILTDAIIEFDYTTSINEKREESTFVPSVYRSAGKCESGDDAQFTISWKNYDWTIFFSKTPGGDHWYVEKMYLDVDTQDKHLVHVNRQQPKLHFESKDQGMLFPTPVGKSYACDDEVSVVLNDGDVVAKVILRKLKMQPYIFKKNDFGPEHVCSPGGGKSYRDETAPIAVGSTLAIVSILTVTGYGVYRYMKVKKVQYDTME